MIEPTECESKRTLDAFVDAMKAIARESETDPDLVNTAPPPTPVSRLDEAQAPATQTSTGNPANCHPGTLGRIWGGVQSPLP